MHREDKYCFVKDIFPFYFYIYEHIYICLSAFVHIYVCIYPESQCKIFLLCINSKNFKGIVEFPCFNF